MDVMALTGHPLSICFYHLMFSSALSHINGYIQSWEPTDSASLAPCRASRLPMKEESVWLSWFSLSCGSIDSVSRCGHKTECLFSWTLRVCQWLPGWGSVVSADTLLACTLQIQKLFEFKHWVTLQSVCILFLNSRPTSSQHTPATALQSG